MWTTRDELAYLDTIGQHTDNATVKDMSKREMLRSYLRAAAQRSDWGMVSREAVILEAEEMLRELVGEM